MAGAELLGSSLRLPRPAPGVALPRPMRPRSPSSAGARLDPALMGLIGWLRSIGFLPACLERAKEDKASAPPSDPAIPPLPSLLRMAISVSPPPSSSVSPETKAAEDSLRACRQSLVSHWSLALNAGSIMRMM